MKNKDELPGIVNLNNNMAPHDMASEDEGDQGEQPHLAHVDPPDHPLDNLVSRDPDGWYELFRRVADDPKKFEPYAPPGRPGKK